MQYDKESGALAVGLTEWVMLARRGISTALPVEEEEALSPALRYALGEAMPDAKEESLFYSFEGEGQTHFELHARVQHISFDSLTVARGVEGDPKRPPKALVAQVRGEAFTAAYMYAKIAGYKKIKLRILYINPDTFAFVEKNESLSLEKLETFFIKCRTAVEIFARPAIDRVMRRLPSLERLAFPYGKMREGQDAFVHGVYRAVSGGKTLYAEAPTGIGKTVSALYPALRALGKGKCDKIFYLTPKTTIAYSARDCIYDMEKKGALLRAVILSSKDRICPNRRACTDGAERCEVSGNRRLTEATLWMFDNAPTVAEERDIRLAAARFAVCPHELSLSYSELCDVVICDFNYLFDPVVYLKRYFTEGGRYAFLVDEAHNLPDRASEMYSARVEESELLGASLALPEHSPLAKEIENVKNCFHNILYPYVKESIRKDEEGREIGFAHGRDLPEGLYELFSSLLHAAEQTLHSLYGKRSASELRPLKDYYYKLKRFFGILTIFDRRYEYFIFLEAGVLSLKLFCIDPSGVIRERLSKGHSAVFFSGTLSPLHYFRSVLGGDGEILEVPSPFVREQMSISVMDKIGTRYLQREDTLPAVLRVIAATVSARRGNYMIFTPSFAYNEALAAAFRAKYPKIRVLEQKRSMRTEEREAFLSAFREEGGGYLVAFCVMGGVYAEGIDLAGDGLIGAIIVGTGLPSVSYEREAMAAYYDEKYEAGKQYAYIYPGFHRVLQAAGRVIRTENDRGVIVLIDDRFSDPLYKKSVPQLWHGLKFVGDARGLRMLLDKFWAEADAERARAAEAQD
ncbi:MAG: ATP-dependent DNA helicase [Clostridia bacterium]|nr:ATP-dependent DNA helicase [Clostridia bacterium]